LEKVIEKKVWRQKVYRERGLKKEGFLDCFENLYIKIVECFMLRFGVCGKKIRNFLDQNMWCEYGMGGMGGNVFFFFFCVCLPHDMRYVVCDFILLFFGKKPLAFYVGEVKIL